MYVVIEFLGWAHASRPSEYSSTSRWLNSIGSSQTGHSHTVHLRRYLRPPHQLLCGAEFQVSKISSVKETCRRTCRLFYYLSERQLVLAYLQRYKAESRQSRPLTELPARDQFRHVLSRFITATMSGELRTRKPSRETTPGLKALPPYWYSYTTMAKERWIGREILEVVSTEFRDRSMEYYRYALESGVTTINGQVANPKTVIRNGDRIENVVHRHEPPVTSTPVKIVLHDKEREILIIDKPGSIPVHATGRYNRQSLVEILHTEHGFNKVYTINRLDRLTSGLMILPLSPEVARQLTKEFVHGSVRKEYVARCKGELPAEEIVCEKPLLTVDRQMGLNIVHPEGKPAKTVFNRLRYDAKTDTSIVRCRPFTGRSHQIRVHLQYLGHPIANDPVYSEERIWGPNLGKNGIDVIPSNERFAPAPPSHLQVDNSPESLSNGADATGPHNAQGQPERKLLPRETGDDIGMGSPVPLSSEAVGIIYRMRNMKDEDEDWSRWRDVVFRAKAVLTPKEYSRLPPLPPQHRRKRGGKDITVREDSAESSPFPSNILESSPSASQCTGPEREAAEGIAQLSVDEALAKAPTMGAPPPSVDPATGTLYCPECYLPLHPDPKPEKLYIFLHALKYTTSLGCFETEMPEWAAEGWQWDRS